MKTSENGRTFICSFETLKTSPYECQAGVPTIGYGSTVYEDGTKVKLTDPPVTPKRAMTLFMTTLKAYEDDVNDLLDKARVTATQNQFDALVSFNYNLGKRNTKKIVDLMPLKLKIYAANKILDFDKYFDKKLNRYVVSNGLVRRRKAERQLFLS